MARFSGGSGGGGDSVPGPQGLPGPTGPAGADGAGFNYQGDFDYGVTYAANDAVTFQGGLWKLNNTIGAGGYTPTPGQWTLILPPGATGPSGAEGATGPSGADGSGIVYLGDYIPGNGYVANIAVVKGSDNNLYIATSSGGLGDPVANPGEWSIFLPKGADGSAGEGFNWRGEWVSDVTYVLNDTVSYEGSTYVAVEPAKGGSWTNHPSVSGNDAWNILASGFNFRNEWSSTPSIPYIVNDVVLHEGNLYIAVPSTGGNSGNPVNDSGWSLLLPAGEGFTFRGEYNIDIPEPYEVNDLITYQGSIYLCISALAPVLPPISAGMPNTSQWTLFIQKPSGFNWRGTWSNMANPSYVAEDVVEYEGSVYLCTPQSFPVSSMPPFGNSGSPQPGPNPDWELMASAGEGFNWRGAWSQMPMTAYAANDVVNYNDSLYFAIDRGPNPAGSGTPDPYGNAGWDLMIQGFNWRGAWSSMPSDGAYAAGDLVSYQGSVYLGVTNMGSPPSGTPGESMNYSWQLFMGNTAPKWRGAWSSMPSPSYVVNDLVSYNGSVWIGVPGSMNMGVMGTPGSSETWQIFASGFRNRGPWLSNPMDGLGAYTINDVVSYLGSSYVRTALPNPEETNAPTNEMGSIYPNWALLASKGDVGSSANTGDITFDGIQIIGAGTASGDGASNGTIELVPDLDLITNQYSPDQYLIIDPTSPNHIHIRAGGQQDNSSAHLYLGAERNNVEVSDPYRTVKINTRPPRIQNTYANSNEASNSEFMVANGADIQVGYTVTNYTGGDTFTVTAVTVDYPYAGLTTVVAQGLSFVAGDSYIFTFEANYNNLWTFGSDGILSGPAMGSVAVNGLYNNPGYDLYVGSGDAVVVTGSEGEFLNDSSIPANQIATIGDFGAESTTSFQSVRYTPTFTATGLTFTGTGATHPTYNSYYVKQGKLVSFVIEVDLSTVTNFGTGQYKLQLPFTPQFGFNHFTGWAWADPNVSPDVGTGHTIINADTAGVTDVLDLHYLKSAGGANAPITEGLFVQGTPVTLSTISKIYINGTYIAA